MSRDAIVATLAILVSFLSVWISAQAIRQGQRLPTGPPRYYLREGSPQEICAPYVSLDETKPSWTCIPSSQVVALILREPPDCGH